MAAHSRYSTVAIALHWLIALLILGNLVGGLLLDTFLDNPDPAMKATGFVIIGVHKSVGITVLALSVLRLLWRLGHPVPALPNHMTSLERLLAKLTHWGFYALMLALPLSGWAMSSASLKRFPISWFNLVDVPFLPIEQAKSTAGFFHESHELLAWAAIATIVVHVAAALKHHFFDRDDVLARMTPWVRSRGA